MPSLQLSDATAVEPDLISPMEKAHFYHGVSDNPPELVYRSDGETNPFIIPETPLGHSPLPEKTIHGASDPALTPTIWRNTVGPAIVALLEEKDCCIRLSTLMAVRFSTVIPYEDELPVFGPTVIWISVHPGTTTPTACRDASPAILHLLESHGVQGAVVQWYEASVQRLLGPPMMPIVDNIDPTSSVRQALTAVLGVPLAAEEMEETDSQGSLAFFFHEGEDQRGNPSSRVFGVTNNHVARKNPNVDYELGRSGAAKAFIRVCGERRFETTVGKTKQMIEDNASVTERLAGQIATLEKAQSTIEEGTDQAETNEFTLKWRKLELEKAVRDNVELEKFRKDLDVNWREPLQRTIGWVDWAPKIRNDVDERAYTLDIATFELDKSKWEKEFKGNFVYLGGKYTPEEIKVIFYPNIASPPSFKYPQDDLFRIIGFVTAEDLRKPYFLDEKGEPAFIVAKDGQSTGLTFGRYSAMEAFTHDEFDHRSWEVPIYNYGSGAGVNHMPKAQGVFADKGDSGSLVFNAEGKMVGIIHSGTQKGSSLKNHVTFATPAHFVIDQIRLRYPKADFSRLEF